MVHKGFLNAYESLAGELIPALNKLLMQLPNAKVHVTGHSLGGTTKERS